MYIYIYTYYFFVFQFRFANGLDLFLIIVAVLTSCFQGSTLPVLMLIFGEIVDMFIEESRGNMLLKDVPWTLYNTTKEEALSSEYYK